MKKKNKKRILIYQKKDKRDGKGIYDFNDGRIYDGEWKKDKRDGKGVFIFNNGNKYDGEWKKKKKKKKRKKREKK